jgi:hypothetical protein
MIVMKLKKFEGTKKSPLFKKKYYYLISRWFVLRVTFPAINGSVA